MYWITLLRNQCQNCHNKIQLYENLPWKEYWQWPWPIVIESQRCMFWKSFYMDIKYYFSFVELCAFWGKQIFKIRPSYLILILKWINNFIHVENLNRIESVDLFTWNLQVSVIQVFVSPWLGYHTAGYAKMFL